MKFCELIEQKLKELKLTQRELAEEVGVSKDTICNWKNGRSVPSRTDEVILKLCEIFKLDKEIIFKTMMESSDIYDSKENDRKKSNYLFLPNNIFDLKLSEEEINILYMMEFNKEIVLDFESYLKVLDDYSKVLITKEKLENILEIICLEDLLTIIRKNNLKVFDIQELDKEDIYFILKSLGYVSDFKSICEKIKNEFVYINNSFKKDYFSDDIYFNKSCEQTRMIGEKDKLTKNNSKEIYINREYDSTSVENYSFKIKLADCIDTYLNVFSQYFNFVSKIKEEDSLEYQKKLELYEHEFKIWEEKMEKIKECRALYNNSKDGDDSREIVPDLPAPIEPEKLETKMLLVLNYQGLLFRNFIKEMEEFERIKNDNKNEFVQNARFELEPYLNKELSFIGICAEKVKEGYLFRDLISENEHIFLDHMWFYDVKEELLIGNLYELKGNVIIYEKKDKGKDYKIDLKEFSKFEC